jgi:hypothetical protein
MIKEVLHDKINQKNPPIGCVGLADHHKNHEDQQTIPNPCPEHTFLQGLYPNRPEKYQNEWGPEFVGKQRRSEIHLLEVPPSQPDPIHLGLVFS